VIAHTGNASGAPENTLSAFKQAFELGVDYLECDVQLSKDGVPVLVHDGHFMRTTNAQTRAPVDSYILAEIKQLDAGSWFGLQFVGERIPTLEELLTLPRGTTGLMLDIKEETFQEGKLGEAVLELLLEQQNILIGTLSPEILQFFQKLLPPEQLIATIEHEEDCEKFLEANVHCYALSHLLITPERIQDYHQRGKKVWAWTVDDPTKMRTLIAEGVDGIITNFPALLCK